MNCWPRPDGHRIEQRAARRRLLVGRKRRIEEQHEAVAGARADLVIAARCDPRRGGEQGSGGLEEIGLPGVPVVPIGTALAALVALRARTFAIDVIADMDEQLTLLAWSSRCLQRVSSGEALTIVISGLSLRICPLQSVERLVG